MTSIRKAQIIGFFVGVSTFAVVRHISPSSSWLVLGAWQVLVQLVITTAIVILFEWREIRKEAEAKQKQPVPVEPVAPTYTLEPMRPAEAHVWIAVYAAEFAKRRQTFECIVAADVAVHDLQEEDRRRRILDPLNAALRL